MNKRAIGYMGENEVKDFLSSKGYKIIKSNYCVRGGEIDIIAQKDDIIAFVEVKARRQYSMTSGFEAVTFKKKLLIARTANKFMIKEKCDLQPRFDVAEVIFIGDKVLSINYIEGAFDTTGMNINY